LKHNLLILFFLNILTSQIEPTRGIRDNSPRVWVLTNATVHTEPGDFIKNGNIVIRDGKIDKVGRYIKIPPDAYEIDLKGSHVYAGFIDGWVDVKRNKENSTEFRGHWNQNIKANYRAIDDLNFTENELNNLRSIGITTIHAVPTDGIIKGQSDVVVISKNPKVISDPISQVIELKPIAPKNRKYPNSMLGAVALVRQTFIDADWYNKAISISKKFPEENEPIRQDLSLSEIYNFKVNKLPWLFKTNDEHAAIRALNICNEFNLKPWLLGSGYEYRRLEEITKYNPFIILPLKFPSKPQVAETYTRLQYNNSELKHWDLAPDNIALIQEKGIFFSFSSHGLISKSKFRLNIQRIIDRGFSKDVALAALTTYPAEAMGVNKFLGKIQKGYMANLVIVDGDYFDAKSRVLSVWINGDEYFISDKNPFSFRGKWELSMGNKKYELNLIIPAAVNNPLEYNFNQEKINSNLIGFIKYDDKKYDFKDVKVFKNNISFIMAGLPFGYKGHISFNASINENKLSGLANNGLDLEIPFTAMKLSPALVTERFIDKKSDLTIHYPEGAYGLKNLRDFPNAVLLNDATLWTSGPKGVLEEWDILFIDGKIDKIAPEISVPRGSAMVINLQGKHITPGLIDCHSHSATSSINEGTQSNTAEVRIKDVLNADDINIYRQLAGGLTCANILHGSANPIGGQNAIIKLRWGSGPNALLFNKAPQGIKFALGENVKQANWSGNNRYPQTRMGVEQIIRDAFTAAVAYSRKWETYNSNAKLQRVKVPPRKDLELEALVEILNGTRLVHCHAYRQDEIIMLTRIAEEFGFTISSFQHVLEGYKVADRIAEHGAGASTFSDWWNYKFEVIDAIPYNGALMSRNGVNVSFNSDDSELARRLNTEALKAIKYGNLSKEEALKLITINPAKQLKIDKWVGSLEEGKDADIVVWDAPPLSIYSHVEETWIDGIKYWSILENQELEKRDSELRKKLIQKIISYEAPY
tara:strand:- start:1396 stop:4347 length:2952 start_codon:yes stop_codon:yes gene_type:complete